MLLYASLATSLLTASFAILGKQWIGQYLRNYGGSTTNKGRDRERKLGGLEKWCFQLIVESFLVSLNSPCCYRAVTCRCICRRSARRRSSNRHDDAHRKTRRGSLQSRLLFFLLPPPRHSLTVVPLNPPFPRGPDSASLYRITLVSLHHRLSSSPLFQRSLRYFRVGCTEHIRLYCRHPLHHVRSSTPPQSAT